MDELYQQNKAASTSKLRQAYPEGPIHLPSLPIIFSSKPKESNTDTDAAAWKAFNLWKSEAKGFSWKLFTLSQARSDEIRAGPEGRAVDFFHTFASEVLKKHQWKWIHPLTVWRHLPDKHKTPWKEAVSNAGSDPRSTSSAPACSNTTTPKFIDDTPCGNGQWRYFTFQVAAGPSVTPSVDNGSHDLRRPENSRKGLPVSRRTSKIQAPAQYSSFLGDPNLDGAIFPGANVMHTREISTTRGSIRTTAPSLLHLDTFVGPFSFFPATQRSSQDVGTQNPFEAPTSDCLNTASGITQPLSNFEHIAWKLGPASPSPSLGLATGLLGDIPRFDFGPISQSLDYSTTFLRGSNLPPHPESRNTRGEGELSLISFDTTAVPPARKRRRLNPNDDANPNYCLPLHHPLIQQPSIPQTLTELRTSSVPTSSLFDDLLGPRVPTWLTDTPNSQFLPTEDQFQSTFHDVPFIGGESSEQHSQHEGFRSNSGPWSPVDATVTSSPALQHASAPATADPPIFDLDLDHISIATTECCVDAQTTASTQNRMLEFGLSDADYALLFAEFPIPGISPPNNSPTDAEYPSSFPGEPQEGTETSTYDFFAGFQS